MEENQQKNPSDYMIEKIKQRPVNKRKLIRRTIITVCMAVLFGLVACFTFLILEPLFNKWLYKEEPKKVIIFPEETEEMLPEDMITTEEEKKANDTEPLVEEQIEELLSGVSLEVHHYGQMYEAMNRYVKELAPSMVTVTGIISETDWFNNPYESKGQDFGVIIADNGQEFLVLTDCTSFHRVSRLVVTFYNGEQADAKLKQSDGRTNLAILAVSKENMSIETQENFKIAVLGSSILDAKPGEPVVALGSPLGKNGSISYGMVASNPESINILDFNYKIFLTDMYGSPSAKGVLFNLQGEIIGLIENEKNTSDMKNVISALGVSELKKTIAKMSNGETVPYIGIYGADVTQRAHEELGVPYGAYVNQVAIDSPAMKAGIQCGDILIYLGSETIENYDDYVAALLRSEVGNSIPVKVMRQVQDDYKKMTLKVTLEVAE